MPEHVEEGSMLGTDGSKLYVPARVRHVLFLDAGDKVEFVIDEDTRVVTIRKKRT
jgi:bifunctional DNA-binding transcriptional regulator/antitoxin component of YhaV-PrlF toxin-antitoxin module